jgi:hypothetical protein
MQEQILNTIGLQQLLKKQGSIYMNIFKLLGMHKGQISFQLQDFQDLFQHNGRQGYKQRLNYLLTVTLKRGCLILMSNQSKGGWKGLGFRRPRAKITSSCNQDCNQEDH